MYHGQKKNKMQTEIEMVKGRIRGKERVREIINSLDDGTYTLSITRANPLLTPRDCQKAYFSKIDICVKHTGHSRQEIHDLFKTHVDIPTTQALTVPEWKELFNTLQIWAYSNFDCIV